MDRYNIKTRQGIIQFVKKHLDEINHDGEEHATMQKGEWAFDTEAVRILDQLRGLHDQATITELESEKVSNAQQESHNLRILLLKAQQDLNTAQQQVITLQQNLIAKQNELSEVKVKALEAQQNKDQADALQSELDRAVKNVTAQYASQPGQLPPQNVLERQVLERLVLMRLQIARATEAGITAGEEDIQAAVQGIAEQNTNNSRKHWPPSRLNETACASSWPKKTTAIGGNSGNNHIPGTGTMAWKS